MISSTDGGSSEDDDPDSNPPKSPFLKRGNITVTLKNPSLKKRGRGRLIA
jgi:hypothetical protein